MQYTQRNTAMGNQLFDHLRKTDELVSERSLIDEGVAEHCKITRRQIRILIHERAITSIHVMNDPGRVNVADAVA